MTKQNRDISLDIAKAICIILMVVGHSGCPEFLQKFGNTFRMPCFFFISGLLFSEKYFTNLSFGIKKKLKGYGLPVVKWGLIFVLFHNVFVNLHIYDETARLSSSQFFYRVLKIATVTGGEQLLGGFWFLISMTWASVISVIFCHFLSKYNNLTNFSILGGVIFSLLVAFGEAFMPKIILSAHFGPQTFLATAFFMTGYLCKRMNILQLNIMKWKTVLILVPIMVVPFFAFRMTDAQGFEVFIYYVLAICGSLGIMGISSFVSKTRMSRFFTYIGNKTLYILIFHFLAFKGVSYIYILIHNLPITCLSQFPVLESAPSYLWIIYAIFGIASSIAIWEIVDKFQKRFAKSL